MIVRLLVLILLLPAAALAVLPDGAKAPELTGRDLQGAAVEGMPRAGQVTVLVFGELFHPGTRDAWVRIDRVLLDTRLAGERITPVLIVAQDLTLEQRRQQAANLPGAGLVVHDPQRQSFGDYRITVMPTVVVIDAAGQIVHGLPGLTARFQDILTDALLVAAGRLSREQFQLTLHPQQAEALSEHLVRANRVAQLAHQLTQRGLDEMAQEKYAEALALWPNHAEARLGLGRLFLKRRRIADAETQFRALLTVNPNSVEASLGVAFVHTLRGGEELQQADAIVRDVLERDKSQARAHYLMGMIHERRDQVDRAAASYKRAAELLLERQGVQ